MGSLAGLPAILASDPAGGIVPALSAEPAEPPDGVLADASDGVLADASELPLGDGGIELAESGLAGAPSAVVDDGVVDAEFADKVSPPADSPADGGGELAGVLASAFRSFLTN